MQKKNAGQKLPESICWFSFHLQLYNINVQKEESAKIGIHICKKVRPKIGA